MSSPTPRVDPAMVIALRDDLRAVIRAGAGAPELEKAIFAAIGAKPQGHDFQIDGARPAVARHMSTTGG